MPDVPLKMRCDRRWDALQGSGPERYCAGCDRTVYDLESLDPDRRATLLGSPERVCVRFLSAALAATLATSSPAIAQERPAPGEGPLPDYSEAREVMGVFDKSIITNAITEGMPELREAYRKRLKKNKHLAGKIVVTFTVEDRAVTEATIRSSTLGDAPFEQTVLDFFHNLPFPHDGPRIVVSYPLLFGP